MKLKLIGLVLLTAVTAFSQGQPAIYLTQPYIGNGLDTATDAYTAQLSIGLDTTNQIKFANTNSGLQFTNGATYLVTNAITITSNALVATFGSGMLTAQNAYTNEVIGTNQIANNYSNVIVLGGSSVAGIHTITSTTFKWSAFLNMWTNTVTGFTVTNNNGVYVIRSNTGVALYSGVIGGLWSIVGGSLPVPNSSGFGSLEDFKTSGRVFTNLYWDWTETPKLAGISFSNSIASYDGQWVIRSAFGSGGGITISNAVPGGAAFFIGNSNTVSSWQAYNAPQDSLLNGPAINIFSGKGAGSSLQVPSSGKPGGDFIIRGGNGGDIVSGSGLAGGAGGDVHIDAGAGGGEDSFGPDGSIFIGTSTGNQVVIGPGATFSTATFSTAINMSSSANINWSAGAGLADNYGYFISSDGAGILTINGSEEELNIQGNVYFYASIHAPTNGSAVSTVAKSITLGTTFQNDTTARAQWAGSFIFNDAVGGGPTLVYSNMTTGLVLTNGFPQGLSATFPSSFTTPVLSPGDSINIMDRSGTGASITFVKGWWIKQ